MRRTLPVLVVGLVAALLGVVGVAGVASAISTTPEQAAKQEAENLREAAEPGRPPQLAPRPQGYGTR
ncbi:hypothetical protein [Plantactinospora endophytica]|uniref:DUF2613 domain-containing protein n=1 Tax=Plantactinospora endophytica TaxID=673535 RepID=A0ABQ4E1H1_9ACTN|nr:hypothetical protein [Plantactinospora endophytica]GIG88551.1 hypothetical protein Pen02_34870 [Plantactinospora endophytica]